MLFNRNVKINNKIRLRACFPKTGFLLLWLFIFSFSACEFDDEGVSCGNGKIEAGEECDDGNDIDNDGCTNLCNLPACGDGIVQAGEECDDGNDLDYDGCSNDCRLPACGDGILQEGEECDDGNLSNNDSCINECKIARCGDGYLHIGVETCDDGNDVDNDSCKNDCSLPTCGNGIVEPGEECDDGNASNADECLNTCVEARCGDGFLQRGVEECDDGNKVDGDGCSSECKLPSCGDGIVQIGEECDDGNGDNTDGCLNTCKLAQCGDGVVQAGVEECDDGNLNDNDNCPTNCKFAECGDGFVQQGVEECDDGNDNNNDSCMNNCMAPACGDGILWEGVEECDDGNIDNTDGCLMNCTTHSWCDELEINDITPPTVCVGSIPPQLTLQGHGFAVIEGDQPRAFINETEVNVVSMNNCQSVSGVYLTAQVCTEMVIETLPGLDVGNHEIKVVLPTSENCEDSLIFSVGEQPLLTSVVPSLVCEGSNTFTLFGDNFVEATRVFFDTTEADSTNYIDPTEMEATFNLLNPGIYDVTVSNGTGCDDTLTQTVEVVPTPTIYFVDPPVIYNGINIQATVYLSGINGGNVNSVMIRPSDGSGSWQSLSYNYDSSRPNRLLIDVPAGLDPGFWDIMVDDAVGCVAQLDSAFEVTEDLTLALETIDPPFGWTDSETAVAMYTEEPLPAGMVGFVELPRAYLNPVSAAPGDFAFPLKSTVFVNSQKITSVVPSGLTPGDYDVIVVNPTGEVGLIPGGYTVTEEQPPVIDTVSPGSIPNDSPKELVVKGSGFNNPDATFICKDDADVITNYVLTVNTSSATRLDVTAPADLLSEGTVCVVRVTNPDTSYGEFSAVGITNPSENITQTTEDASMIIARRAPSAVYGSVNTSTRFLYVMGGDNGDVTGAYQSIEAAFVSRFGELGDWRVISRELPEPLTFAQATVIGRFIFLVGGNDGTGAKNSVYRSKILDPNQAPFISDVYLDAADQNVGITSGLWYYRVSAIMDPADPDNPGGETLPGDAQPVNVPSTLGTLKVTLYWDAVPGAVGYRVYRTPAAGMGANETELIAEVGGGTTSYLDNGDVTDPSVTPKVIGDIGKWKVLPSMQGHREGFGLGKGLDPLTGDVMYLYAVGGRDENGNALDTYEYIPVSMAITDVPAGETWSIGADTINNPRWQLQAYSVDQVATILVSENETWIYAGGGVDSTGSINVTNVDTAQIQPGGSLAPWTAIQSFSPAYAGYGYAAAGNQLFLFGGQGHAPSNNCTSGILCDGSTGCAFPDVENWNSIGINLVYDRYLLDSSVGAAHIFLVGGLTTGDVPTNSVESTIW